MSCFPRSAPSKRESHGTAINRGRASGSRTDEATAFVAEVIENNPENAAAWILKGDLETQLGSPETAEIAYREAINVAPDTIETYQALVGHLLRYGRNGEAIEIANSTDYGVVGGVFTRDLDRATRVAEGVRAGQVFVNEWYAGGVETPFGGYGKSGYGREKGREALWNYVQTKNIAIRLKG